jgi:Flp pilus assembly protein TadB
MEAIRVLFENLNITGNMWTYISIGSLFVIFVLIFVGVLFIYKYLQESKVISESISKLKRELDSRDHARVEEEKKYRDIYGASDKVSFLKKIDLKLKHSTLQNRFEWMTVEVFLVFTVVIGVVMLILGILFTGSLMIALGCVLGIILVEYVSLTVISSIMRRKVEDCVISFANMVENFAASNSELMTIFDQTAVQMAEPLRGALKRCVRRAQTRGGYGVAIDEMCDEVGYDMFTQLVKNLEIASRHEANYKEIIFECRDVLQTSIRDSRERKEIYRNGRIEIVVLWAVAYFVLQMLGDIVGWEGGVFNGIMSMSFGFVAMGAIVLTILVCIYLAFIKGMSKG